MSQDSNRASLSAEIRRLKAALSAIHDKLHADDIDGAHELVECALGGQTVSQPNLSVADAASGLDFAARFNALAEQYGKHACCIIVERSASRPGHASLQLCGEVFACKVVEQQLRGSASTYMGDHALPENEALG